MNMKPPTKCELEKELIVAAEHKDYKVVEKLLNQGVNPNARKRDRITPLHIAAERGDIELAKLLVNAKGLNLNAFTVHGYTPLIIACNSRQDAFVEFLLEHGADVNMPERFGKTAMHHVAFMDCVSIAQILINHGANVNLLDVFFHSPLSIAVVDRHCLAMAKFLIQHGADLNLDRGVCGLAIHLFLEACLASCDGTTLDIVNYLLDDGVDPNVRDPQTDRNGLHYFAINNYIPLGELLIQRGTDRYHKDVYNLSPLELAKQQYNIEAAQFLENTDTQGLYDETQSRSEFYE